MPRAKESLKIEVEQATADDVRTVTVTITAPAKDFLLPDLLSQRGAVRPFEAILKESVRGTTEAYLSNAEDLIAGIAAGQKQEQKGEPPAPKARLNGNEKGTKPAASKRESRNTEQPENLPTAEPLMTTAALSATGD